MGCGEKGNALLPQLPSSPTKYSNSRLIWGGGLFLELAPGASSIFVTQAGQLSSVLHVEHHGRSGAWSSCA